MEGQTSLMKQTNSSCRILCSSQRILRSQMLLNEDPGQMHLFFNQGKHFVRFSMIVNSQTLYYTCVYQTRNEM